MTVDRDVGIHQVLVDASPGDAVTNVARWYRRILRRVGPSEMYALRIEPALMGEFLPLWEYRPQHARNVLIFHASIGEPGMQGFLFSRPETLVLAYHSLRPSESFERHDAAFAELLALGRREVAGLRPHVAGAIADSGFAADELRAMGYSDVRVVPPIGAARRLARQPPDPARARALEQLERPIMLGVGELMPHKRPDFLVEALYVGQTYLGLRGSLLLVGNPALSRYAEALRAFVQGTRIDRVHLTGLVTDRELAAMYDAADVVFSASEHDGFGLPLVEAMMFSAPVLARACAAVPETVGDAGLLLPEWDGPELFAEAAAELLANERLREHFVERGRVRVDAFDEESAGAAFLGLLREVV